MKRFLSSILAVVFVIGVCFSAPFTLKAKAASVSDLTFELNEDGQSYSVSDCNSSASGEIVIPDTYNGLPATSIGNYAFEDCTSLTSITIPDSVTSIGDYTFRDCSSLTSVTIPDSVTSIGYSAFTYCESLTSVNITDLAAWCNIDFANYSANPLYYANNLYLNGELVTELVIPDGVTEIKYYAFYNCTSLTSITIPDGVTSIGYYAFYYCSSLTSVNIPDSVTSIGDDAFYNCSSLTSITIPNSVTSIGSGAFGSCYSLTSVNIADLTAWCNIGFGNNALPSYYNLYLNGELLTDLVIPDSVTKIKQYAFYDCNSLTSVTIPDSVTSIGSSAFSGCSSLTSITIPNSVTSIGSDAFSDTAYYNNSNNWENDVLYIGNHLIKANTTLSNEYAIKSGTQVIADSAFSGCSSLTSVTIPDSVTSIGYSAFDDCSSLTSVNITDLAAWCNIDFADISFYALYYSLDEFISNPLYYAENLYLNGELITDLTIPDGVTKIKQNAFFGCSSIKSVKIPESVTSIGEAAFSDCNSLKSVNIADLAAWCNIDFADNYSEFYNNPGVSETKYFISNPLYYAKNLYLNGELVTDLAIPESVTEIKDYAFYNCSSLTNITIPDSVTSIGYYAFRGCSSLTGVHITNLTSWCNIDFTGSYDNPFCYADNLYLNGELVTDLVVPDGVTEIKNYAFYNCTSLTSITIPDSVTSIGGYAFSGCSSLTSVNITDISSWCNIDFSSSAANPLYYAKNLYLNGELVTDLVIPEGVTEIKYNVFYNCSSLTSVTIPDSVTSIGEYTFNGCASLTNVTIGENVASISSNAFIVCESLDSINVSTENNYYSSENGILFNKNKTELILYPKGNSTTSLIIPDGVTSIGDKTFYGSSSLVSVTIPDSVTSIGEYAFAYCKSLTNITIGSGVTDIGSSAFANCESLTSVTICEGATSIGDYAFSFCSLLASITIPDSVTSIGTSAFLHCSSLTRVNITDLAAWCNIDFGDNPLYYANNLYLNGELVTDLVIPDGVTEIKYDAFHGCSSLTSVTIPDSVTSIGGSAFSGCSFLTSVTIPDSVTSIGNSAFSDCNSLKSVHITDVAAWCDIDFADISEIRYYGEPRMVYYISNPLYYAKNLYLNGELVTDLIIPESVIEIKRNAFYGCSSIKSVTIPDSVTSIGGSAFSECDSLTSVNITNLASWCELRFSPNTIYSYSPEFSDRTYFYCCISNPLYYAKDLYLNGELVTDLVIPEGVTEIKDYAFQYCSSLTNITIPYSVTSIGDAAFYNSSLKYVFYTGSSDDWNNISMNYTNDCLTAQPIHYNSTEHSHNVTTRLPISADDEGVKEDICPVCDFVNSTEKLVWLNDYIAAVDTKDVVVDTTSNTLLLDISASKDLGEAIIEMDGYTLTTTPNSDFGYFGTGSKVEVKDTNGTQVAEYTLVVRGDVNGDSVCDVLDCMLIELARNKHTTLDGVYLAAGDLAENGEITEDDFNAIVNKAIA